MKNTLTAAATLMLTTSIASAGGVERAVPSVGLLYESGNYLELNFGYVSPEVSGTQSVNAGPGSLAGADSGNMSEDYTQLGFGYKNDLSENLSLALIIDQPIGADVDYSGDTTYLYGGGGGNPEGSSASIDSVGITTILNYKMDNSINVYGGLRAIRTSGEVSLFSGYEMSTSDETDYGYLVGVGWERPEIAARVSLTYHSEVTHDFDADENGTTTEFSTTIPQSLTLEGQTGVAADTLVFGSIRWVDWTEFDITPVGYEAATGDALVEYDDDTITYNVGVGRRFNDAWSGAVTAGYEAENDGFSGNLGPTDGNTSLGVALTHTMDNIRITGGVRHIWIGDAETESPSALPYPEGTTFSEFEDNTAWAAGLRVAVNF